ncbi:uncharacterized protein LOC128863863 [Anastrepha ludens]|uniref:uncharacterized protein LOC128855614 n=1 Tax=Anastrepha ludens TaxID=28586 RepID=UPI0023B066B3|nr:uncharacterized protein LOC128855614 [Anastrepha ludens]XP_053959214.1 uncharacterized protein LOC128863863 [Anastrepha ludens]
MNKTNIKQTTQQKIPSRRGRPVGSTKLMAGSKTTPSVAKVLTKSKTVKETPPHSQVASTSSKTDSGAENPLITKSVLPETGKTSRTEVSRKPIPPHLRRYRDRRRATFLTEKFGKTPEEELSDQQKSTLGWAREFLRKYEASKEKPSAAKRQRSSEDPSSSNDPKKHKASSEVKLRKFCEVARDSLVMAVVDKSHPDGFISPSNWKIVERKLQLGYLDVLKQNPGPPPFCSDAGWFQARVKLIACSDQRSVSLYGKALDRLGEVWPGANLQLIKKSEIPNKPRGRARIPVEPSDPETILELLKIGNPNLPTENWRVVKVEEPSGNSRHVTLLLDQESVQALDDRKGIVAFGFTTTTIWTYQPKNLLAPSEESTAAPEMDVDKPLSQDSTIESDSESNSELVGNLFNIQLGDEDSLLDSGDDANATVIECPSKSAAD